MESILKEFIAALAEVTAAGYGEVNLKILVNNSKPVSYLINKQTTKLFNKIDAPK